MLKVLDHHFSNEQKKKNAKGNHTFKREINMIYTHLGRMFNSRVSLFSDCYINISLFIQIQFHKIDNPEKITMCYFCSIANTSTLLELKWKQKRNLLNTNGFYGLKLLLINYQTTKYSVREHFIKTFRPRGIFPM